MASIKSLIALAFVAAMGILMLLLGCALYDNWYPMFILAFYVFAPVPCLVGKHFSEDMDPNENPLWDLCIFLTSGIVVSAFGLPMLFAHQSVIAIMSCALIMGGNVLVFVTILAYFLLFTGDDQFSFATWI